MPEAKTLLGFPYRVVPLTEPRDAAEPFLTYGRFEHRMNGNCWIDAYPCPAGICPGVCDRCHEHDALRAACASCLRCPLCGRSGEE